MLVEQWMDFGAAKKGPAAYFLQAHDPEKARGRPRPIGVAKLVITNLQDSITEAVQLAYVAL